MEKITAWFLLAIISAIEVILLYGGYNGGIQAILIPSVAYLMGIVTKTGIDKIVQNNKKNK